MAPSRPACPPPDVLRAAMERVLPEDWQQEVDQHVRACAHCESLAAAFVAAEPPDLTPLEENRIRSRIGLPPVVQPVQSNRRRWWYWIPVPVAALLVLIAVMLSLRTPEAPTPQMANTPVRQPEIQPETKTQPAAWKLPLEPAALKLPLGTLVWRGEDDTNTSQKRYLEQLGASLEPYRAGRYDDAVLRLQGLSAQYPKAIEPVFYQAVSLLFLHRANEALPLLERARSLPNEALATDINWYFAIAYERTGRWTDASALLAEVCKAESQHSSAACAALR